MFKFIFGILTMKDSTLNLFCEHQDKKDADEFAMKVEQKAKELEVTVDYYLAEFI